MDPLEQAVHHLADYGGGPKITFDVPENAVITLGPDVGTSLLDGVTITRWAE